MGSRRLIRSFPKFIFNVNQSNLSRLEHSEEGNAGCLAEMILFPTPIDNS